MSDATLLEEARAAINAGNMPAARDRLRAMQAPPPMVLAQVCARLGDAEGEAELTASTGC